MKASETSFRNLLEGTKQFQIPLFQRPYSWKKSDWETLWEDLMRLYNNEIEGSHFLGSIVTQALPGTADSISPYLVIDGQQRLITLTIILLSLRFYLKEENAHGVKLAEELYECYLINKFKSDNNYYKVLPTQDDQEVYKKIILDESINDTLKSKMIFKAYDFFRERLKTKKSEAKIDYGRYKNLLLERIVFVNITSDDRDNPYLIFESLNNKGQELTQADLVRNYIFMKLPHNERDTVYAQKWLPLETSFKNIIPQEDKFANILTNSFWFYLRKDGESVNQKDVYKAIRKHLDCSNINIKDELEKIIKFSYYYQRMAFSELEEEANLKKFFTYFNRLDFSTCHIFLLNVYNDYQEKRLCINDFVRILNYLESYFVRRFFTDKPTKSLGKIFDNLYKEVTQTVKNKNLATLADGLYQVLESYEGEKIWPSDDEFKQGIMTKSIYSKSSNDRVKLFLEILESHQTQEIVNFTNLSIEHIMPQKLTSDWQNTLGNSHAKIHKNLVHTLGNLTLTAYNSSLSNSSFDKKLKLFKDSNVYLNKYLCQLNTWNEEEIKNRANHLADLAIKVWPR
ncbi:DUF262 domain-containing protein [Chroococcus sp. FPU101]|uniref:DUF262 domain-containing protein n=1 Tax=Chroococcus sp. FPU101 TaxID=1974212 RepID=UPI001A8D3518|nr:DUF262 domain-containing protein [Chroococcus sp. FPU101]